MTHRSRRFWYIFTAVVGIAIAGFDPIGGHARAGSLPTPSETASMEMPPPLSATATPAPSGTLLKYSGEILDYRDGYVFFTTGDAFRVDPAVKISDAVKGGTTSLQPQTAVFARASFDTGSGGIVELALSKNKLPDESAYQSIKKFAVVLSTPAANPDLTFGGGFNGKGVPVTFRVEVPPKTPFSDQVYLATDVSGWSATAVRMDRVDALHYKATRSFASGTKLLYRYTRGSWQSADVDQNGLAERPRVLVVKNADYRVVDDVVYAWQDENQFDAQNGSAIPTPFNPVPFNIPPHH